MVWCRKVGTEPLMKMCPELYLLVKCVRTFCRSIQANFIWLTTLRLSGVGHLIFQSSIWNKLIFGCHAIGEKLVPGNRYATIQVIQVTASDRFDLCQIKFAFIVSLFGSWEAKAVFGRPR